MADYSGLTRNGWPGTWSPDGDHPIVLSNEVRGGIHSVSGEPGDTLADITRQRLQEGMLVYLKNSYGQFDGDTYYQYKLDADESRNLSTGEMPNNVSNWVKLSFASSGSATSLGELTDVSSASPDAGALLQFNPNSDQWEPTNNVSTPDGTLRLNGGTF